MSKNTHNEMVGSEIVRSDDRIDQTGEVFTPAELCASMVSEIPESILKNLRVLFLIILRDQGTSYWHCK